MKYEVIIPQKANPTHDEIVVAEILKNYFCENVEFLMPIDSYLRKTPDVIIHGVMWEIKSPRTDKLKKIENIVSHAKHQSPNIIIDNLSSKISDQELEKLLKRLIQEHHSIQRLLMITKENKVLELKK